MDKDLELTWQDQDPILFRRGFTFGAFLNNTNIVDVNCHYKLKNGLIEHLWAMKGNNLF